MSLAQLAFSDLPMELANTRKTLERIPDAHFDYRPHAKSWTIGNIGVHLARLPLWGTAMLEQSEFDLATLPPSDSGGITTTAGILELFDRNAAALRTMLDAASDEAMLAPWTLRRGEHVIVTMPRHAALRASCVSHFVHHRGQLTMYLRLLDVPLPALYGPSADER